MPKVITIPKLELWDSINNRFVYTKEYTFTIEHSLVSIAKWESKWKKPFLSNDKKTEEEITDYIRMMTITQNVDPNAYNYLTNAVVKEIYDYMNDPMTATWFGESEDKSHNRKTITAELIYYWMIALNIPMECQKWHLNRLLTLIKVCNEENKPKKKMSQRDLYRRNTSMNAQRKAKYKSKG